MSRPPIGFRLRVLPLIKLGLATLALSIAARSQEFTAFGGLAESNGQHLGPYSWMLDYRQGIYERLEASLTWINEGHFNGDSLMHHRDGLALQAWYDFGSPLRNASISAGLGADYSFDSQAGPGSGAPTFDVHKFLPVGSVDFKWYLSNDWFCRLRTTAVLPFDRAKEPNRILADFGFGYYFGDPNAPHIAELPGLKESLTRDSHSDEAELSFFKGFSRVNTFFRAGGSSYAGEARYRWHSHLDLTLGYLSEGSTTILKRQGVVAEAWLMSNSYKICDKFGIGIGLGVGGYATIDSYIINMGVPSRTPFLAGLVSPTFNINMPYHTFLRVIWNRVISNYNLDADVWLLGIGYRFR